MVSTMLRAVFALTLVSAACGEQVRLWPGDAPGDIPGAVGPEVEIDEKIYNVTVPTYEAFLNESGSGAGVVVAPGGSYLILSIEKEGYDVAKWLNSIGMHAFVLKYRVPERPQSPDKVPYWAPMMDAQRAMGMIRSKAADFKLNASRLGFLGFSAGGHLTAHITTGWQERIYNKTIPADDLSCRPDFSVLNYPWRVVTPNLTNIAPELIDGIGPDMPPCFFSQAMDDPVAPCENSLLFVNEMKKKKAPMSELHLWPHGGHGYGLCQTELEVCTWPDRAEAWFAANKWI